MVIPRKTAFVKLSRAKNEIFPALPRILCRKVEDAGIRSSPNRFPRLVCRMNLYGDRHADLTAHQM